MKGWWCELSRKQIRYFYNPAYVGYLRELKKLAEHGGGISREKALLADIKSGVDLSPDQIRLFHDPKYYGGSLRALQSSVDYKEYNMRQAWMRFLTASDAAGIERTHGRNSADYPLYKRFYDLLGALEVDCDLRAKVHAWISDAQAKIEKGVAVVSPEPDDLDPTYKWKKLEMLSVPVIMARYDKLLQQRKKK